MINRKLLATGITGSVIAALCCFTPVLALLLGAVGLSAWLGWLDYVLFPALGLFVGITIYALIRRRKDTPDECRDAGVNTEPESRKDF